MKGVMFVLALLLGVVAIAAVFERFHLNHNIGAAFSMVWGFVLYAVMFDIGGRRP